MSQEPLVPRDELRATLAARQELGSEFEPELVERFAQQLEQRLEERARRPAQRRDPATTGQQTAVSIVSLIVSIPLMGIAGGTVGVPGVALICLALVLVNYFVWKD